MLNYGSKVAISKILPKEQKRSEEVSFFDWLQKTFYSIASFFSEVLLNAVLQVGASILFPGVGIVAGVLIRSGIGFISSVINDAIFGREIDWTGALVGAAISSVAVIKHIIKTPKAYKFLNRAFRSEKAANRVAKYSKHFNTAKQFIGASFSGIKGISNFISGELFKFAKSKISKIKLQNIKIGKFSLFKSGTNLLKVTDNLKKVYKSFLNPLNALDELLSEARKKGTIGLKKLINKSFSKIKEWRILKTNLSTKRTLRALKKEYGNKIDFPESAWISGIKIIDFERWEQGDDVSYTIYFNWESTKTKNSLINRKGQAIGKLPIIRWSVPKRELLNFISASSKGKYYLDNILWGWGINSTKNQFIDYEKGLYSYKRKNWEEIDLFERDNQHFQILNTQQEKEEYIQKYQSLSKLRNNRRYGNLFAIKNGSKFGLFSADALLNFNRKGSYVVPKVPRYIPKKKG